MAPKNQESKPIVRSSDETDSDSASSSSEEETLQPALSPPTADKKSAAKNTMGSGSESYESDPLLKSIASKTIEEGSKLKKPRSRPNSKPSPAKTPIKRPTAALVEKDSKKLKTEKGEDEGKKSVLFQRLWSDNDEVAILNGMLEYKEKKGADPMVDAHDFHDFIRESLHVDVDRKQVVDKVRRLKKRYGNSMEKRKTFNPHEKIVLDLSKKIWGQKVEKTDLDEEINKINIKTRPISMITGNAEIDSPATNGSKKEAEGEKVRNPGQFIGKASVSMGLDESIVGVGLELCSEDKKAEMEEKWRKLHLETSDLFVRKLELAREESEMIIAALRSGTK